MDENTTSRQSWVWQLAHGRSLELGRVSRIMGILNATPDSFSDGNLFLDVDSAIDHAAKMISEGADIIDVGGESTRPGAQPVDPATEQERVLPIIAAISARFDTVLSVDTYRSDTADKAIVAGAHIVNDIGGLSYDDQMAASIGRHHAGVCIMHNSRDRQLDKNPITDQQIYFDSAIQIATKAGISHSQIVVDPGIGFGKDAGDNLYLLKNMRKFQAFDHPILIGTSRKRFVGSLLAEDDNIANRDIVSSATSVIARMAGCCVFRVHNVAINKHVLNMADAVLDSPDST